MSRYWSAGKYPFRLAQRVVRAGLELFDRLVDAHWISRLKIFSVRVSSLFNSPASKVGASSEDIPCSMRLWQ
ncbi:MAG: hypothetical protein Q4D38_06770 [Planctomycetia bacterium]|nr:hypothetical protein [Planctomycetia bacterium]